MEFGQSVSLLFFVSVFCKYMLTMSQKVNKTSGLQIHSLMYRFHPSVRWTRGYPSQGQIVEQIRLLWKRYHLEEKTKFNFTVSKTYKDNQGRWIINNPSNGRFDGIVAAIGTCGTPAMPSFDEQDKFQGEVYHSSQLNGYVFPSSVFRLPTCPTPSLFSATFPTQANAAT